MGYAEEMPAEQGGRSIMFAPWPKPFDSDTRDFYSLDDCYLDYVNSKYELVTQGRNLRREANIAANKKVKFIIKRENELPPNDIAVLKLLLNAEDLQVLPEYEPKKGTLTVKTEMGELYLPTEGLIDVAAETNRLRKELEKIQGEIAKVQQKLANPAFTQKVPAEVLADHQKRLVDWQEKLAHVQKAIHILNS
jgi:valyl-tRNA synthetase